MPTPGDKSRMRPYGIVNLSYGLSEISRWHSLTCFSANKGRKLARTPVSTCRRSVQFDTLQTHQRIRVMSSCCSTFEVCHARIFRRKRRCLSRAPQWRDRSIRSNEGTKFILTIRAIQETASLTGLIPWRRKTRCSIRPIADTFPARPALVSSRPDQDSLPRVSCTIYLLPRRGGRHPVYDTLSRVLAHAPRCTGCTGKVSLHRLRHTYATEMVRLGVSLPALMQTLGHKDINMTLRYVEVMERYLQREFHRARQNTASLHSIPQLPRPSPTAPAYADLSTIREAIAATRHLLPLFYAQLQDP